MTFLRCMNKKCQVVIRVPHVSEIDPPPMYWKWKDNTKMTKINVCKSCWEKARTLKVPQK
jgi:hypothetical protein